MLRPLVFLLLLSISACSADSPSGSSIPGGGTEIFNGTDLTGWEGDPTYWRVEDSVLIGEITPETVVDRNTFLI
ncbi:hypothetical protein [Lewinella sp. IMCC34183]|uniref:hypothetical protein n=1 Tax=Lewinella sp. IMCC34183 TaxID=2248762 RepID=UPI0018E51ADA|nr:hypothetical protein [Lewinella sp. IMCC34183]